MNIPYWALNESKKRKLDLQWGEMPVYELCIKFLDCKGRFKFKSLFLAQGTLLSPSLLTKLVKQIEDEQYDLIRKTEGDWYEHTSALLA